MSNHFLAASQLKCLVLCAGKGERFLPDTLKIPKPMIKIRNKPILGYLIDYWKKYTNDFIFVVGYKKNQIIEFVKKIPINSQFVEQKRPRGIAEAILCAEGLVSDNFIVVLGDCICKGKFNFPQNMEQGVGIWQTNNIGDIKQGYSIKINNNLVVEAKEKPKKVLNNLCGMGHYFLNKKVFDYIKNAKPSKLRGEIELTDVIQKMIERGEKIKPVFLRGRYLNVTEQPDIKRAEDILK